MPLRIALDAMGGDNAPRAIVEGAVAAANQAGSDIILVGIQEIIEEELRRLNYNGSTITIKHASETVQMGEPAAAALRQKKDSSIRVAVDLVKSDEAQGVVTAGNTGAALAASMVVLRTLKGIDRPAIAALIPTYNGFSVLLDVGANVDCKATQLLQFGVMGYVYAKYVLKKPNPTVGLLSIGAEETKGNEATKEAYHLLKNSSINFIGNVEAREVYQGHADVIVSDGFSGNVAIKISESAAEFLEHSFRKYFHNTWRCKLGFLLMMPEIKALKRSMDYSEYGGAPLLGVNGACIIAHGSSNPKAIKNAVFLAERFVLNKANQHIQDDVAFNQEIQYMPREKKGRFWKNIKDTISFTSERDENGPQT